MATTAPTVIAVIPEMAASSFAGGATAPELAAAALAFVEAMTLVFAAKDLNFTAPIETVAAPIEYSAAN